ncbi:MAG: hypothetical protein J4415_01880 [Candidatus Diapherotrites archaeon]|uniref:Uncharacterized protein n=1 Tax=Candidatus Iainarchaeum sp. TaxID=3101447 RepID=A0A8T4KTU5_9ARCH|nr:hypothetical protein [Candidatus Diapherotrites archaeon]
MGSLRFASFLLFAALLLSLAGAYGANIDSWRISGKSAGESAQIYAVLKNSGAKSDFLLEAKIMLVDSLEYYGIAAVQGLDANSTREVSFSKPWAPEVAGSYIIELNLIASDSNEKIAKLMDSFSISGNESYGLYVKCFKDSLSVGEALDANILIANTGSSYEDIQLEWHILDQNGNKITGGSMPLAVYPNSFRELTAKEVIPSSSRPGLYKFSAALRHNSETKSASCTFIAEAYKSGTELLNEKVKSLQEELSASKASARASSTAYASLIGGASLLGIAVAIGFIIALAILYFKSKKGEGRERA